MAVDFFRLATYGAMFFFRHFHIIMQPGGIKLVGAATLAAFIGAIVGSRLTAALQTIGFHKIGRENLTPLMISVTYL